MKTFALSISLLLCVFFVVPDVVLGAAGGLIPCDGPECQACHFLQLGQGLLNWFIKAMAAVIVVIFAWGGLKMVMSGGSSEGVSEGKGMMTNAVIGFVILLGAWLIINTVLVTVVSRDPEIQKWLGDGKWNQLKCVAQPVYKQLPPDTARPVVGGGTNPTLGSDDVASRIAATNKYRDTLCAIAARNGIPDQCDSLQAIMGVESHGNPTAHSEFATGLMQITPNTACTLDSTLCKKSASELYAVLTNPERSMELGTKYYAQLYNQFDGNEELAFAAYNGGPGANRPSQNCDGKLMWECEWDDDAHTIPDMADKKGYGETRKYVPNVAKVRDMLKSQ